MRAAKSLPPEYFERMFAGTPDPWDFETSPYETAKYEHTLDALGERRFRRALEIGCANGVLTERLAGHCEELLAIDVSETALGAARARCARYNHVQLTRLSFPGEAPIGTSFDLIILSEVAYYWDETDLSLAGRKLLDLLAPTGDLLLVHWSGETDYPQSGDDAVESLHGALGSEVETVLHERRTMYRLDLWRRRPS